MITATPTSRDGPSSSIDPIADRFSDAEEHLLSRPALQRLGDRRFPGTFHLFKGGRELKGTFTSPLAGVNDWRFPKLRGGVEDPIDWRSPSASEAVRRHGQFDYRMAPLGKPTTPAKATWDVEYENVDLARLTDFLETEGLRLAGRASGRNHLEWPLGKWALKRGSGDVAVQPPPGMRPMTRELPMDLVTALVALPQEAGPFNPRLPLGICPSLAASPTRSIPNGSASIAATPRPIAPTSSSRGRPRSASDRGFRFTSPAPTGRRAIDCSPGS